MESFDAARVHHVWRHLISDEALCDAVLAGDHDVIVDDRGFSATDRAILDQFASNPEALQWNIDNLRFRGSMDTMLKLRRWMPLTTRAADRRQDRLAARSVS